MAGGNYLIDEVGPVVRPLLLQNGDQDQVEFVDQCAFGSELFLGAGIFDDEIDDKIANSYRNPRAGSC